MNEVSTVPWLTRSFTRRASCDPIIFDLCWDHYRFTHGQLDSLEPTTELSDEDRLFTQLKRALSMPGDIESILASKRVSNSRYACGSELEEIVEDLILNGPDDEGIFSETRLFTTLRNKFKSLAAHFPTFFTALPRLPFGLIPFAFSQFILIEGLSHQGWIDIFATWLVKATHRQVIPTIWLIGVLGVILSNVAGTNIGATILLTKVVHAAPDFPASSTRAAAIALAVASNIGAASFTFSASLAGLLWKSIWKSKGIRIKQSTFAFWNCLPLLAMTGVGLGIVTGEMKILY